jgi:hypothetical protein
LLLGHQDPLERPRFGGEPDQLEKIASYLKAMDDLESAARATSLCLQKQIPPRSRKERANQEK